MAAPPVPIWLGVVHGGRLALDVRADFDAYVRGLSGRVELVIRRAKSKRSLDQNAYVFGVAYPLLADALGYDAHEIEDLHYALVAKWGGEHFDKRLNAMVPNKRSSRLSTVEFSEYMEWLVRFGAETCGCVIPLPGESEAA
jgi:hypothetical protein